MRVLITGAGSVMGQSIYKALSLHNFGETLEVHFANSDPLGAGRYFSNKNCPIVASPIFPLAREECYLDYIDEYVKRNAIDIVFTGTQHELEKISIFRDRTIKAATLPSSVAIVCMDKLKTAHLLSLHGIREPKTQILSEYLLQPKTTGAVILKPNNSSSSRNIYRFDSREHFFSEYEKLKLDINNFLVQERLIGEEFTCGCYIDRYSKKISQIIFKRTLTQDGATFYGEITQHKEILAYVREVALILIKNGLDFGHINIQLILDPSGPCLFEINGRLSSTEGSKAYFGFNSCAAYIYNIVRETSFDSWEIAQNGKFLRYYEEVYF